jgi:hypothetical protein
VPPFPAVPPPPSHNLAKIISNTIITTTPPIVRRILLCGCCGGGGGGGGTSEALGVLILPGSGVGGGGPVGTSGSGRCAAPQLGQKFVDCLISVPQFSQNRLPPSVKMASLLTRCPTTAILRGGVCLLCSVAFRDVPLSLGRLLLRAHLHPRALNIGVVPPFRVGALPEARWPPPLLVATVSNHCRGQYSWTAGSPLVGRASEYLSKRITRCVNFYR